MLVYEESGGTHFVSVGLEITPTTGSCSCELAAAAPPPAATLCCCSCTGLGRGRGRCFSFNWLACPSRTSSCSSLGTPGVVPTGGYASRTTKRTALQVARVPGPQPLTRRGPTARTTHICSNCHHHLCPLISTVCFCSHHLCPMPTVCGCSYRYSRFLIILVQ